MGLRVLKPTSPGQRNATLSDFGDVTKSRPEKTLSRQLRKTGGRNSAGRVSTRHRGGGARRQYRIIDFVRDQKRPGEVKSIEYDPNRSARIALVQYENGQKTYVIAHQGIVVGQKIHSGDGVELQAGNSTRIGQLPAGTYVHNIELSPGSGARMVRSAGAVAQVMAQEGEYTLVRLPSGEMRRVLALCASTIGQVGNLDHKHVKLGKAGRARNMGLRPEVRGAAMSPRDHPHGGGEGKNGAGMPQRKTKWGRPARGPRTRNNKRTDSLILRKRYQK